MRREVRDRLGEISRAATEGGALHALLGWLDTLPTDLLIVAEARRRAGMVPNGVSGALPPYRPTNDPGSTVLLQVESEERLARTYWEHPAMIWTDSTPKGVL